MRPAPIAIAPRRIQVAPHTLRVQVEFLLGPVPSGTPVKLADALTAPDVLRSFLQNRRVVVGYLIAGVVPDSAAATERRFRDWAASAANG